MVAWSKEEKRLKEKGVAKWVLSKLSHDPHSKHYFGKASSKAYTAEL
jgi:hypothetical protein